jgi:hypothetical protein
LIQGQINFSGGGGVTLQKEPSTPQNGIVDVTGPLYLGQSAIRTHVTIGDESLAVNQCFKFESSGPTLTTHVVKSIDAAYPRVDGVMFEGGGTGDSKPAGCIHGSIYDTHGIIAGSVYLPIWLGQDGLMTTVVPTLAAGDVWMVRLGTLIATGSVLWAFKWAPEEPIKL